MHTINCWMQKKWFFPRYNISDLFLDDFDYSDWFVPQIVDYAKVTTMWWLEGDEKEVKKEPKSNLQANY